MYQPSFDRFSSVTTSRGAIAPDAIRKIVNSENPVEIEHDNPKDVIQNSSEAEYGEFMEKCREVMGNRGSLEAFIEATKEGNDHRSWKKCRSIGKDA